MLEGELMHHLAGTQVQFFGSPIFDALRDRRQEIEEAVGESLDWDRLDHRQAARISLYYPDEIQVTDEERWPEAREWLIDAMGRMRAAFNPAVEELPD